MNIDFTNHVALIALADEEGQEVIIGGGVAMVVTKPGTAEIAFVTIDDYQGQGVGTLLMHHLAILARQAELRELVAEVLPENAAMRKVFVKLALRFAAEGIHRSHLPGATLAMITNARIRYLPAKAQRSEHCFIAPEENDVNAPRHYHPRATKSLTLPAAACGGWEDSTDADIPDFAE